VRIGIPKESFPGERRVAITPHVVGVLTKAGAEIVLEANAGAAAGFPDHEYIEKGVHIVPSRAEVFASAEVVAQVRAGGANPVAGVADLELVRPGQIIVAFLDPLGAPGSARDLAARGAVTLAMELIPRITRAQSMDALSSMATISGYKAVVLAAEALPRLFPLLMTAAGTVAAAHVLIVGAGVAGLQAIATARRLGAVVSAYDIRPTSRQEVESLGAKFVDLPVAAADAQDASGYARAQSEEFYRQQREALASSVAHSDAVITTAAVPGKRAPLLVTADMVARMRPGSVIIDIAAERGGNCELTRAGETVLHDGVTIIGPVNIESTVPYHASQLYAKNVATLLLHLVKDGRVHLDASDPIVVGILVAQDGTVVHPQVRAMLESRAT
jgi:NAD(P) transhydrogenase subunit alpha